nr:PREDICTED: uncharacterized protein LOC105662864 [Megachile rotundata]
MSKVTRSERVSGAQRKDLSKERKQVFNPKTAEIHDESFASTSAKKLKSQEEKYVPEDGTLQYALIDFFLVFSTLSTFVKCSNVINENGEDKVCNGKVNFKQCVKFGLGFKIVVECEKCQPRYILSCAKIGKSYEVNRRFIFVMRILGLGLAGCKKFCGLMDISCSFLNKSTYDFYVDKIHECAKMVAESLFFSAAKEEKKLTCEENDIQDTTDVTVSTEFEEWQEEHIEKNQCSANHQGPAGNMEVTSIVAMFQRSFEKYGLKYKNYIGDGDSKTYTGIINAEPYGKNFLITKKECVGHVQKRMGTRLRDLVNKTVEEKQTKAGKTIRKKTLSGKGRLTGKLIDKLTIYYGLAIRRNSDSVENMKNAIWATYFHYTSTDKNPQHNKCPNSPDSWCTWQRASTMNTLSSFKHDYNPLPNDVSVAIKPIYEELSKEELLERCIGGFTQNNESFNQLIWKITPKILPAGSKIVEIAAFVAAGTFNEGIAGLLLFMHGMGVKLGRNSHEYARKEDENRIRKEDENRILVAEKKADAGPREARIRHRHEQKDALDIAAAAGSLLYGAGIDDSM